MPDFPAVIDLGALGSAGWAMWGGVDFARTGHSVASAGDVNDDGIEDFIIGAPGQAGGGDSRAFVIYGKASGFTTIKDLTAITAADGFIILNDAGGDQAGISVSSAGDLNNDGIDDLIVGANLGDNGGDAAGEAYVIFGKAGMRANIDLTNALGADGFIIQGDATLDQAGFSVASADFNGDGIDDIVIGAPFGNGQVADSGAAYLIFGHSGAFSNVDLTNPLGAAGVVFRGEASVDQAGFSVASAGDINGDGRDDLLIGATQTDNLPIAGGLGTVYVVFGKASPAATIDLASLGAADGFTIRGEPYDKVGFSVASAGDVNGDGFADIIVGTPYADDGNAGPFFPNDSWGAAYVIFGKASGFGNIDLTNPIAPSDGFAIIADAKYDSLGQSVASAGDVNGDGFDDLIVGAPGGEPTGDPAGADKGQAYVIFGKASGFGTIDLGNALPDTVGFIIQGDNNADRAGFDVSSADVNNDGFTDMLVGAPVFSTFDLGPPPLQHSADGAAYVVFGRAPTTAVTRVGAAGDQAIRGGAFDDTLSGLGGNDSLYGGGGADTMLGGVGNDSYLVDQAGDIVMESVGSGYDTVYALASYELGVDQEIEVLTVFDRATVGAINLTGNDLVNVIYGNQGANVLNGGKGNDTLYGLGGNDAYIIEEAGDVVVEVAAGGTDTVYTLVSYDLGFDQQIEVLTVYDRNTAGALNLAGNNLANVIYGNQGSNLLNGGHGNDTLYGLGGNDAYIVEEAGDLVIEAAGGGFDTVYTLTSYQLFTGEEVETLTVYDRTTSNALNLTGNNLTNSIYGNAGANVIDGKGGNDVLYGMGGADTFRFTTGPGPGNADTLTDFSGVDDMIALDDVAFLGIGSPGALNPNAFVVGTAAQDADDRIVYNQATGQLFFDADGNGAGAAVLFATLEGAPLLTASDFIII